MSSRIIISRVGVAVVLFAALIVMSASMPAARAEGTLDATQIQALVDRALGDMLKGRFGLAMSKVDEALKAAPANIAANQMMTDLCWLWQYDYNKEKLAASKTALGEQSVGETAKIMEMINAGKTDDAIKQVKDLISATPESDSRSLWQYILARAYLKAGKGGNAVDSLTEALGWDGEFEQAYYDLASILMQLGRPNDALQLATVLLNHNRDNDDWWLLLAAVQANANRAGQAMGLAESLLQKYANQKMDTGRQVGLAHQVLALASYRGFLATADADKMKELLTDAVAACDEAVQQAEQQVAPAQILAGLEKSMGKAAPVLGPMTLRDIAAQVVAAKDEKNAAAKAAQAKEAAAKLRALYDTAMAMKKKLEGDMLEHAEKAVGADPKLAEPLALLARYYQQLPGAENLEKAATYYQKYIEVRPDATDQRYSLGLIRLIQGKTGEAAPIFAEIKNPDAEKTANELSSLGAGLVAGLKGDAEGARTAFDDLRALREKKQLGESAFFELMLAHACLAQGDAEAAKTHLKIGASALGGLAVTDKTDYAALLGTTDIAAIGPLNFSMALIDAGFVDQAIAECDKFLATFPADKPSGAGKFFHFMLIRGKPEMLAEAEKDLDAMKTDFQAKDPTNVTPFLAAALLYGDLRSKETVPAKQDELDKQLLATYAAAKAANPGFGNTYAIEAEYYIGRGQITKAVDSAKEGLKNDGTNRGVLQVRVKAMQLQGTAKPQEYIDLYETFFLKIQGSGGVNTDLLDTMTDLAAYYRQLNRIQDAIAEYKEIHDTIDNMPADTDAQKQEKENRQKKYFGAYLNLRELSIAQGKVADAREYNGEVKKINPDYPGCDHFEGLCLMLENNYDGAQAAFDEEVKKGGLSMTTAMSKIGLAVIALRKATTAQDIATVHTNIDSGQHIEELIRKRDTDIFGGDTTGIRVMGGYLEFVRVCAYLAQAQFDPNTKRDKIGFAATSLNRASVLFPGSEGWMATTTNAFKGINLAQNVLPNWQSDSNFADLAEGSFFLGQGVLEKSIGCLNKEIEKNPTNFIALLFEARAQRALGNNGRAIELLIQCGKDENGANFIPALTELYAIYLAEAKKQGETISDPEGADNTRITALLNKLWQIDPVFRFELTRYYTQDCKFEKDANIDKAIEQYDMLCKETNLPNRYIALNGAAWLRVQYRHKDPEELQKAYTSAKEAVDLVEAIQVFDQNGAMQKLSLRGTINDTFGWVIYKQGLLENDRAKAKVKYQDSAMALRKSISDLFQVDPNQESIPTVLYHLALAYDGARQKTDVAAERDDYRQKAVDALKSAVRFAKFDDKDAAQTLLDTLQKEAPSEPTPVPEPAPEPAPAPEGGGPDAPAAP